MLLAIALCGVGVACGGASKTSGSATPLAAGPGATGGASTSTPSSTTRSAHKNDNDNDGDGGADDILWGHAGSPRDTRTVAALVKHYYALALSGDGAGGCSLIYSIFAEEIPEVYGESAGEPALRGKTCATVMSKYYRSVHDRIAREAATLDVVRLRVKGLRGLAFLQSSHTPEHDIQVHREHRLWKIDGLLGGGLG